MDAPLTTEISDFKRRDVEFEGKTKPVLITGETGPAVVVIHEIYGFTPAVARLCRWVRDAGFRVYAPILFGRTDATNEERHLLGRMLGLCISREFTIFAVNRSSPVVDWLKPLARQAHQECGLKAKGQPPHSVFTIDLIDEAGQPPTREAVNKIIAFFEHALRPSLEQI
jgi:hypothetical protein